MTSLFALSLLSAPLFAQQPPAQADQTPPAGVEERQITFPTDGLVAPGTLTLPASPHPGLSLLVMIGGSGVHNHNSTVGPHKILQQLSWGLAQRGIATLRFDRRPVFNLASFNAHPDLDHEVVIDAASALAFAATLPEIDPHKIYLLGHSLGGELAPYIVAMRLAQEPASVRGIVLMSGVARPFDVTMLEQMRLPDAQGRTPAQIDQRVASWTAVFDAARDPKTPASEPLGVGMTKAPAQYWRDWLNRNPVAGLQNLGLPALVLGGTNDLNPSHEDFEMLRKAATASGSASLELPGLNREYVAAPPGVVSSTFVPAQVAPAVLDTIAQWVTTGQIDSKLP